MLSGFIGCPLNHGNTGVGTVVPALIRVKNCNKAEKESLKGACANEQISFVR